MLIDMKTPQALGSPDVLLELIAASGKVGNQVMIELCQGVLDGFAILAEWVIGLVVTIFVG